MSGREELIERRRALLTGIISKVRQDAFAAYQGNSKPKYTRQDAPITPQVIEGHLTGKQPIACYTVIGEQTSVAILDLDDHDKSLGWEAIVAAARPIVDSLKAEGLKPFCCRSGGGAGMHIWLIWDAPQSAKLVKQFLRGLIERHGFKHGAGGVQKNEIEVFPKNDVVKEGSYGNAVAPPYSRNSVPLDDDLQPLAWPDYEPPELADLLSPNVTEVYQPPVAPAAAPPKPAKRPVTPRPNGETLPGDDDEARSALKLVEADEYETWSRVGLALKHSLGASAFSIWDEWSAKSVKYPGQDECRKFWDGFNPDGTLTIGTVFHLAQERGWDGPKHAVVREMNERYGILTYGSTTRIIVKEPAPGEVLTLLGKQAFIDRLAPEKFPQDDGREGVTWIPKASYWLAHRHAAHYHQVIFNPAKPSGHNGASWNMWQGFAVVPRKGDWSRLQHHIHVNICGGDEELTAWMLNWMALGVQKPEVVIGTAPVLKGLPGTGKGILANAYGRLFGPHYVSITKDEHVSGRFNQHLEGRRFVSVDEAMFGGDRRNAGVIKTMLTEPRIMIERKGVDPIWLENHMIFMVTSNERSIVPADIGDRRWQVIEVADTHREDRAYFGAILAEMEGGGHEAMLFDLLHRDISSGPDPHITIRTPELFDQIIQAQGPIERYLYQALDAGYLPQPDAPGNGPGITTIRAMYEDMQRTQANAQYVQQTLFGRTISELFSGVKKVQSGQFITGRDAMGRMLTERSTRYQFPKLAECRSAFEDHMGQKIPWSNDLKQWQDDIDPGYRYSPRKDDDSEAPF